MADESLAILNVPMVINCFDMKILFEEGGQKFKKWISPKFENYLQLLQFRGGIEWRYESNYYRCQTGTNHEMEGRDDKRIITYKRKERKKLFQGRNFSILKLRHKVVCLKGRNGRRNSLSNSNWGNFRNPYNLEYFLSQIRKEKVLYVLPFIMRIWSISIGYLYVEKEN